MILATAPAVDCRGLLSNSLVEWEGRLAAVVFTSHCNWRCAYCHGAALVERPESLPEIPVEAILALIEKQRKWLDGVVLSGGEPTLQPGLVELVRAIKALEMPVKLETNGTRPAVIATLLEEGLLDCLAFDYKAPLDERLVALTGVDAAAAEVKAVRESYALARTATIEREFHTTLCPAYIDESVFTEMAEGLDQPGALWVLQQYETEAEMLDAARAGERRFDVAELDALEAIARRHHERILMRRGRGA